MPYRSILVRAGFAAGAVVLLAGSPGAHAETGQGGQRPSGAELATACRLGRWSAAAELTALVEPQQRRAEDWLCLARAQVHLDRWVAALDSYDELLESESPSSRAAQAAGAVERRELERRLGWIQIVTSAALPAPVRLTLDGEPISAARVGVAFPVQPGTHAFSVEVPGEARQVDHWHIAQGEHRTIGVSIPVSALAAHAHSSAQASRAPSPERPSRERDVAPSGAARRQPKQNQSVSGLRAEPLERWAKGLAIGGGIAGGAGFLLVAASGGSREALYAGLGASALGGASLLAGATLFVANGLARAEPSELDAPPRRLQVQPWILSDGAGTGLSGSF